LSRHFLFSISVLYANETISGTSRISPRYRQRSIITNEFRKQVAHLSSLIRIDLDMFPYQPVAHWQVISGRGQELGVERLQVVHYHALRESHKRVWNGQEAGVISTAQAHSEQTEKYPVHKARQ
jgi:hypothetical protein